MGFVDFQKDVFNSGKSISVKQVYLLKFLRFDNTRLYNKSYITKNRKR